MGKNCGNKVEMTCGETTYAQCAMYESDVNTNSELIEADCKNLEETTQDIYNQLEDINLSELGENCLEYVSEDGRIKVKTVLLTYEQEICELKAKVGELETVAVCNLIITSCGLNFGDLVDECGDQPETLVEVLQLLLNQHITP